jgi:tetratricopeptide (TPR) repeat protein
LQAIKCSDEALKINPRNDIALFNKSWSLIDLGKPREALQYAEKALRVNPRNEYAWYNKAWAHYLLGNRERAIECCNKALEISPGNRIIEHGKEAFLRNRVPEHLRKFKK